MPDTAILRVDSKLPAVCVVTVPMGTVYDGETVRIGEILCVIGLRVHSSDYDSYDRCRITAINSSGKLIVLDPLLRWKARLIMLRRVEE